MHGILERHGLASYQFWTTFMSEICPEIIEYSYAAGQMAQSVQDYSHHNYLFAIVISGVYIMDLKVHNRYGYD